MGRFFGDWSEIEDVIDGFEIEQSDLSEANIIIAVYEGGYEGQAFVVFSRGDKFYEVHGSHCSCYGLEGQWKPEETSVEDLQFRLENARVPMIGAYGEEAVMALQRGLIDEIFEKEVLLKK
jgi:hypothetical protein